MASTQPIQANIKKPDLNIDMKLEVDTGVTIYAGTLVGIDSGKAVVATNALPCAGVAFETYTEGEIALIYHNYVAQLNLSGAAETDIGSTAYVSDNDTVTTTPNVATVGRIVAVDTVNEKAFVHITFLGGALDSAVDSVFGRTGNVVAVAGDYSASEVTNDSTVSGTNVDDALDNLKSFDGYKHMAVEPYAYSAESGTWQWTSVAGQRDGGCYYNKDESNGDYVEFQVPLAKKTYTIRLLHTEGTDHGRIYVKLEGVNQGAVIDLYNASLQVNQTTDRTLDCQEAGLRTIRIQVSDKNGASTSYKMQISSIAIWG